MNKDEIEFKNIKQEELSLVSNKVKEIVDTFFINNHRACVIFLNGDLGAGKTTFTKDFGRVLGVEDNIISPTFILRKDYSGKEYNLIHIDGYRFEKGEEAKSLRLDLEINNDKEIILIEWPERFSSDLELKPDISIYFTHVAEDTRDVKIYS